MTAHALKEDRERCLAAGMDGYVSKPLRIETLLKELTRVLLACGRDIQCAQNSGNKRCKAITRVLVFDENEALLTVNGNRELLKTVIDMFQKEGPALLATIGEAVAKSNAEAIQKNAHKMRGMVGNFGASAASEAAFRLHEIGESGELAKATTAFEELKQELQRLTEVLTAFREK